MKRNSEQFEMDGEKRKEKMRTGSILVIVVAAVVVVIVVVVDVRIFSR